MTEKTGNYAAEIIDSLIKKLEERDEIIAMLRYDIERLKSKLGYNHE